MTKHEQISRDLQHLVAIADEARWPAEDERCRAIQSFYELRGAWRRGFVGDCELVTAFRTAIRATQGGADQ
jgi:hypothetical protein